MYTGGITAYDFSTFLGSAAVLPGRRNSVFIFLYRCTAVPFFVDFGAGGAFGPATRDSLREVARVAGAQAPTDLYHWSAMV